MQPYTTATFLLLIVASAWGQFGFGRKRNSYGSIDRYRDSYRDRDNYGSASTGRGYSNSASSYNGLNSGSASDRDGSSGSSYSGGSSYGGGNSYGAGSSYGGGNGGGGYGGGGYGGGGYGGGYGGHEKGINPLAALVAPLAGLALLGAAAAVATNPVLLTLAVLSSGRKKRDTEDSERHVSVFGLQNLESDKLDLETNRRIKELQTLEKYIATVPGAEKPNEKLMANYLSCSGFTEPENQCIDRIVCEYSDQNGDATTELEKDVISIVLYNIMGNNYVSNDFKDRLREAARVGKSQGQCKRYRCSELKDQQL